MEENNENLAASFCKLGCGFYANQGNEGMCSKCYKDYLKKQQDKQDDAVLNGPNSVANAAVAAAVASSTTIPMSSTTTSILTSTGSMLENVLSAANLESFSQSQSALLERGLAPNLTSTNQTENPISSSQESTQVPVATNTKKKNKCDECHKRVGLTGFDCRCGGLYCSNHRYSDKHNCQFDYKVHGEGEIRKANPQIISAKVEKL